MNARRLLAAGFCSIAATAASAQAPSLYAYDSASITQLGTLNGDTTSYAYDINNAGQIVGSSSDGANMRAYIYQNGSMQVINDIVGVTNWEARGINNNGEVVGRFWAGDNPYTHHPFYWNTSMGQFAPLNDNPYSAYYPNYQWGVAANAINDNGVIVGDAYIKYETVTSPLPDQLGDCFTHIPVRWTSSSADPAMIFCPADLGQASLGIARDINNSGRVVGSDNGSTTYGMFTISAAASTPQSIPFPMNPTLSAGYIKGDANGINNNGAVAGTLTYGVYRRAIYWNGSMSNGSVDLGVLSGGLNSQAREVNDQGFVVGYSEFKDSDQVMHKRAFIYHPHFGMKALPGVMITLSTMADCEAYSLNNRVEDTGVIRAVGHCYVSGKWKAVRWNINTSKKYGLQLP